MNLKIISKYKIFYNYNMTSTTAKNGRYGNQLIRNIAVSLIAEKFNLNVCYSSNQDTTNLGINLFSGEKNYESKMVLNDENYFEILNSANNIESNLNPNDAYFQTKEIISKIYEFLHREEVMQSVIQHNPFKERYKNNNDTYVHVRLGDVKSKNPGLEYYLKALEKVEFENLYISSDNPNHKIITEIKRKYRNHKRVEVIDYGKIKTIQFASTCKNIVLSHGTYSSTIGYLAYFSPSISYPFYEKENAWCGEIFSINGWKEINF
jgi:hypothetical protein